MFRCDCASPLSYVERLINDWYAMNRAAGQTSIPTDVVLRLYHRQININRVSPVISWFVMAPKIRHPTILSEATFPGRGRVPQPIREANRVDGVDLDLAM